MNLSEQDVKYLGKQIKHWEKLVSNTNPRDKGWMRYAMRSEATYVMLLTAGYNYDYQRMQPYKQTGNVRTYIVSDAD